jgi:hypothetical protein
MFPGQNDQFGAPFDAGGGSFSGGSAGGPPPADSIFESAFEGIEDALGEDGLPDVTPDSHEFLTVGLHFFEKMKGMK